MKHLYTKNSKHGIGWKPIFVVAMLVAMVLLATTTEALAAKAVSHGEVAQPNSVENTVISLKAGPTSLKTILDRIEAKNIQIIYKDENVSPYKDISVNVSNVSVGSVLTDVLANTRLEYVVVGDVIAIRLKEDVGGVSVYADNFKRSVNVLVFDKETEEPITGASVLIPEYGVGNYAVRGRAEVSFSASEIKDLIIRVSMIGMQTQEVNWGVGEDRVVVYLEQDVEAIDDIVVTGYANIDKSSFTGSTTKITNEQMMKVSTTNPIAALQIFDPSIRMMDNTTTGSNPNVMPEFYIRGQSGISGTSELDQLTSDDISEFSLTSNPNAPIFMLDGYEVSMEYVYDMDPSRIQSMTILKDAASTAIYGSRAANGVIVIETFAPEPGKLRVSYGFTGSVTAPDLSSYNLMNAQEKLDLDLAAGILDPYFMYPYYMEFYRNSLNNVQQGVDTYWLSQPLQTQFNQAHSIYIDGGEESLRFGLGLRYENQNGVMKESYRDNFSADLKVDYRMNDKLQFTNVVTYSNTDSQDSPYGDFSDYTSMLPYWSPYDLETGELVPSYSNITSTMTVANPLYAATLGSFSNSGYSSLNNNLGINYFFLEGFQLKFQFSAGLTQSTSNAFTSPDDPEFDAEANSTSVTPSTSGRLSTYSSESVSWSSNLYVMYNKSIGEHSMNFTTGVNASSSSSSSESATYLGFANSTLWQPKYASSISSKPSFSDNVTRLMGAFLMGNYTYKDTYLFDVSLRLDGSSEFGTDSRVAPFWSFGAGINLHKYEIFQNIKDVVSMARVTANYGQTGKLNFSPYMAKSTYETETDRWYSTGIGASLVAMGNSDLGWEKTNTLNIATDWAFFNNRIILGLAYYNKITDNLLTDMSLPASSGFTSYKDNLGKVSNRGYEINLNVTPYTSRDLDVNLMVTAAHNKNEILEISDAMKAYNDRVNSYYDDYYYESNSPMLQYVEGASLSSIFGVQSLGISPATGQELYLTKDGEVTDEWSSADQVVIGSTEPDLQGSLGLNVRYKKFTLYASFIYAIGGDAYNTTLINNIDNADILTSNVDVRVMDRWFNQGDLSAYKELNFISPGNTQPTSRFVQENNYLTFNSISLGYTVDSNWLKAAGVSMCRIQASMNDIFTYSSITQERGLSYPYARTFNLSVNLSF
ncbi:MAG: SusC/RagA family TonB-linked outer membrane protein [Rikenellaceae bacterium]